MSINCAVFYSEILNSRHTLTINSQFFIHMRLTVIRVENHHAVGRCFDERL